MALDAHSLVAPSFELSALAATSGSRDVNGNSATFVFGSGALAACPLRFVLGRGFLVRPCAELELGALVVSASVPRSPQTEPWVALGGTARLEWHASRSFMLLASGGVEVPLARPTFSLVTGNTSQQFFDVPAAAGTGRLGAGVTW